MGDLSLYSGDFKGLEIRDFYYFKGYNIIFIFVSFLLRKNYSVYFDINKVFIRKNIFLI